MKSTLSTLAWKSFVFFGRSHSALALGVAAATAVIVGALVVGDSVRASLRGLVITRLANVESLLRLRNFSDHNLIANVTKDDDSILVPVILLTNSSAEHQGSEQTRRASQVQLLAIDDQFVQALDATSRQQISAAPGKDEVYINETLARDLGVQIGDRVTVLLSTSGGVPPDSPLGRRELNAKSLPRQKVIGVISDRSVGAISFQSTQEVTRNVFASLSTVQEFLEVEGKFNAVLELRTSPVDYLSQTSAERALNLGKQLRPTMADFALELTRHKRVFPDSSLGEVSDSDPVTVFDYYQITSKDLIIDRTAERAISAAVGEDKSSRLLTFLANSIQKGGRRQREETQASGVPSPIARRLGQVGAVRSRAPMFPTEGRMVPYSIVTGVSPGSDIDLKVLDASGESLRGAVCVVNTWLAKELDLQVNDSLQIEFYEPETIDGRPVKAFTGLRIVGVVDLQEPKSPYRRNKSAAFDQPPTTCNDPNLTPTVDGITDQQSISSWDVPFELEHRDKILKQDDQYFDNHRLTPKIFVSLASAQQIYASRFGDVTAIRIPAVNFDEEAALREQIERGLQSIAAESGFVFVPVRQQMLAAANGTTPFDMLFLSLSLFVIVAGLMLVSLLFKLGIQQRSGQLGLLMAQGFSAKKLRKLLLIEFLWVALAGALLGIPLGLGYARLLIAGLESWWIGAISTGFLDFSFTFTTLLIGLFAGVATSLLTIFLSLRKISSLPSLTLLRGADVDATTSKAKIRISGWTVPAIALVLALIMLLVASGQSGMARAGNFFGSGMLLLLGAWSAVRQILSQNRRSSNHQTGIFALAWRAIHRNPVRSSLAVGLLAVASFLIASLGVFRISPTKTGYGGFDLIGVSSQPIFENLGSPAVRQNLIGTMSEKLKGSVILPLQMREGDDASCNNLYQPSNPTILGISPTLQSLTESTPGFDFAWAASIKPQAPWDALQGFSTATRDFPIPVILDQNTAMWSLKQGSSLNSLIELNLDGKPVFFKVVGLLNNSVLQGKLIVSDRNFQLLFPKINGFRFFLISSADNNPSEVIDTLESGLSVAGMDVQPSEEILEKLLGVQNTYISAFQSLGALGLLLGTLGLIAVQMRSVLERRRELALMQAVGFSKLRIGNLLTLETVALLGLGLLIGTGSAAVSLIPYVIQVGPQLSVLQPIGLLLVVFACGLISAILATRLALKLPLLGSLRTE